MREDLAPLKADFKQIQGYYSRLQYVQRRAQDEEAAKEQEEESGKEKQILRQKLGLDRFI